MQATELLTVGHKHTSGVLTIYNEKIGNSGWKIKWYVPFRSERSGKSGRSFEPIHFSRSFRFSRLVCEPFQLPALFKIFSRKTKQNGGK